jgi:hypothetical protein
MRTYLERAKKIMDEKKDMNCEEMQELRKEIMETKDPFIRNVLNM